MTDVEAGFEPELPPRATGPPKGAGLDPGTAAEPAEAMCKLAPTGACWVGVVAALGGKIETGTACGNAKPVTIGGGPYPGAGRAPAVGTGAAAGCVAIGCAALACPDVAGIVGRCPGALDNAAADNCTEVAGLVIATVDGVVLARAGGWVATIASRNCPSACCTESVSVVPTGWESGRARLSTWRPICTWVVPLLD